MNLPEPEYQLIPEGVYEFRITHEPEVKKTSYQKEGRTIASKYVKVKMAVRLSAGSRERNYTENFFCHEQRYRDLLAALGGKMGPDGVFHTPDSFRVVGMKFEARLTHVPDKHDPTITRTRIQDIKIPKEEDEDVPPPAEGADDDGVPF